MKIVISGSHYSGKTTLLRAIDTKCLSVDEKISQNESTTVAMDVGKVELQGLPFTVFGTPGFQRFNVIRSIIMKGTDVLIFLFDGESNENDENAMSILKEIHDVSDKKDPRFYIVFCMNKMDVPNHRPVSEIQALLKKAMPEPGWSVLKRVTVMQDANNVKIFEISAKDNTNVPQLLSVVFELAITKWKPLLAEIKKTHYDMAELGKSLNINNDQLKDLVNELEMRKLIKADRTARKIEITSMGQKFLPK
jgi:small GTP-binding protein